MRVEKRKGVVESPIEADRCRPLEIVVRSLLPQNPMRVAPEKIASAVQVIRQRLGDVPVWLFGSRVNDAAKGGDIDLYVELVQPASALAVARARGDLVDALGQNVDLVVNDGRRQWPIYAIARETGVRLA